MIFYCPVCWQQVATPKTVCPRCGTDPQHFSDETAFADKLLNAVFHPEPVSARRAIWILGEKTHHAAVAVFERAIGRSDIYQLLAIVDALKKIGTDDAHRLLERLAEHDSVIVARDAREALEVLSRS